MAVPGAAERCAIQRGSGGAGRWRGGHGGHRKIRFGEPMMVAPHRSPAGGAVRDGGRLARGAGAALDGAGGRNQSCHGRL